MAKLKLRQAIMKIVLDSTILISRRANNTHSTMITFELLEIPFYRKEHQER